MSEVELDYEVLEALEYLEEFAALRPDLLYRPGPTIGRFLDYPGRLALLIAANQVGKTQGLAIWMVRRCLSYDGVSGPGFLMAMVADLENMYSVFCSKLRDVMPVSELSAETTYVDGKGYFSHGKRLIKFSNGAKITFRGGKGEQMAAAGLTCDLGVAIDEIPQRGHFSEALRAAQRFLAPVRMGFTAIGRPAGWLRARISGDPNTGAPPTDADNKGQALWTVFNCGLNTTECPWLSEETVEQIYAQTPTEEQPQRLHGAWEGPTSERLFTGMAPSRVLEHVPEGKGWTVTVAMDHGEKAGREHALLLYSNEQDVIIVDEYVNGKASNVEQDALGILSMLHRNKVHVSNVDRWIGDVNSAGKQSAGQSVNQAIAEAISKLAGAKSGALVQIRKPDKRPGSVEFGTRLMNYALHRGELYVCQAAKSTQRCLWHHKGEGDEFEHGIDALRYGAVDLLRHREAYSGIVWRVG